MVVKLSQTVLSFSTKAGVGVSLYISTVSFASQYCPFNVLLTVHSKLFCPVARPVTAEVLLEGVVIEAPPISATQFPAAPASGILPFKVVLSVQILSSNPALAVTLL